MKLFSRAAHKHDGVLQAVRIHSVYDAHVPVDVALGAYGMRGRDEDGLLHEHVPLRVPVAALCCVLGALVVQDLNGAFVHVLASAAGGGEKWSRFRSHPRWSPHSYPSDHWSQRLCWCGNWYRREGTATVRRCMCVQVRLVEEGPSCSAY